MTRRFFNRQEKAAIAANAGWKCEICAQPLADGWHADHRIPYSKGGATDVVNGQALCPPCNIKKGSNTIMTHLRNWQQEAVDQFMASASQNFLVTACPGAGKTTFALSAARALLDSGKIRRVVVVVPSDALRTQWADNMSAGVHLRPLVGGQPVDHSDYHGVVTTYQAVNGSLAHQIRGAIGDNDKAGTLVILDEIHHAADSSKFGKALAYAFDTVTRRLLLTGTPWRTDERERMPFVEFDDNNMLKVDYSYDYGEAVKGGVCRAIDFPVVDGMASWVRDQEEKSERLTVNRSLKGQDLSDAMRTILDPTSTGEWMRSVIESAHADLMSIRTEYPRAGGLIVAKNRNHAKRIQKLLRHVTGIDAPVVVSAEDEGGSNSSAREQIERFRTSSEPWIIAVKMIAEGVDVPRLTVGVYATNVTTAMFFTQVIGRFVRVNKDVQAASRLYIPPSAALWAAAQEIQAMLPQRLSLEEVAPRDIRDGNGGSGPGDFSVLSSESSGLSQVLTLSGTVDGGLVGKWESFFSATGVPTHYSTKVAASGAVPPAPVVEPTELPRHRQREEKRRTINELVGRVAYRCYGDFRNKKQVWFDLNRHFGTYSVSDLNLSQLSAAESLLRDQLRTGEQIA